MEQNKWEQIENRIRQYIYQHSFAKALEMLKQSAVKKGNVLLQKEIAELAEKFDAYQKAKATLPPSEIHESEQNLVYMLTYFIQCLHDGNAISTRNKPTPVKSQAPKPVKKVGSSKNSFPSSNPPMSDMEPSMAESRPQMSGASAPMPIKIASKPKKVKPQTEGGILYNIPDKMKLGVQTRCVVRLAFDKKQLRKATDNFSNEVIETVEVSEVMEVDLIDLSGEDAFQIKFINNKEQSIDKNSATEWLINVKALKEGSFSLALKVAIIETIGGKDRRREMVLEELIAVANDNVVPTDTFKATTKPFQTVSVIQSLLPIGSPPVKTILFMGANPPETKFLQLDVEHSLIAKELEGKYSFPASTFVRAEDIPKLFIIHTPNIVHFSGHGKDASALVSEGNTRGAAILDDFVETSGIIVFDNDMKRMKVIEDKTLESLFAKAVQQLQIPIEVVVFNSCHSESEAKVVGKSVPYVIGTSNAIKDDVAISFATGFYFGLSQGKSVEKAFIIGQIEASFDNPEVENLIVLYKNGIKLEL